MAYRKNASDKEICDQLCPYHIGDTVTLTKALKAEDGVLEPGTKLKILSVAMRQDLKIRSAPLDQLSLFYADIGVFDFELVDAETSIKVNATADYWGESLVSKKRMNRLLFRLYFPPVCASICMVPFLFVDDLAVIAALSCAFVLGCTAFSSRSLRKKVKPTLWRLHKKVKHQSYYTPFIYGCQGRWQKCNNNVPHMAQSKEDNDKQENITAVMQHHSHNKGKEDSHEPL